MKSLAFVLLFFVTGLALPTLAEEPALTLPGLDGKDCAPFDTEGKKAAVLFFVSPYCPSSNNFGPEMVSIAEDFEGDFTFRYVHSDPSVTAEDRLRHASLMGFEGPVLDDSKQRLAKRLGAKITPEVVVVDPAGKTLYQGRINDLYLAPTRRQREVTKHDLREVLDAVRNGREIATPRTEAMGCKITGLE